MSAVFVCPDNMILRNGKYHYRRRVPSDLVELLGRKEITKSLKTDKVLDATRLKNKLDADLEAFYQACKFSALDQDIARVRLKSILSGKPTPTVHSQEESPAEVKSRTTSKRNKPIHIPTRKRRGSKDKLLSDAVVAYCREYEGRWKDTTRQEFNSQFEIIVEMLGNPPLNDIERPALVEFRDALAETRSPATVNKYMSQLSTLLGYASTLQWINGNPAQRLSLPDRRREDEIRVACSNADVKAIFEALQQDKRVFYESGRYERYWLPLLGLYSGARVNELAQLSVADVFVEDNIPAIRITAQGDPLKRLKSESARRELPLHNDLLTLGFMVYVNNIKDQGHEKLFPNLKPGPKGYSHYFVAKHFTGKNGWMRKKVPTVSDKITFHNFRHTVATQLKNSEEQERLIEELMGHKHSSLSLGRYGKPYKLNIRQRAINKIDYGIIPQPVEVEDHYYCDERQTSIERVYLTIDNTQIQIDPDSRELPQELLQYQRPDIHGYSEFHKEIYHFVQEPSMPD